VAQTLALGTELVGLGRVRRDLLDLGELIAVEVEVPLAAADPLAQLAQLRFTAPALLVGIAVAPAQRQVRRPGEAVEDLHLRRRDRQLAVLVLSVEGE
jgi:hypothetical protein